MTRLAFIAFILFEVWSLASPAQPQSRSLVSTRCPFDDGREYDPDDCLDNIGSTTIENSGSYGPNDRIAFTDNFTSGFLTVSFAGSDKYGRGIYALTDSTFIAFGRTLNTTTYWDFALAKFKADGTLDTTFNTTGTNVVNWGYYDDMPHAISAHSNGTFIVAGRASNGSNLDFSVLRFSSNGVLDTSFGSQGGSVTQISSGSDVARDVAVDGNGKILAAGYYWDGAEYQGAVVRYETNGSLDTSFYTTGIQKLSFGTGSTQFTSVGLDTAGRIFVGGGLFTTDWDALAIRLLSDGTVDTSFQTTGWSRNSFSTGADFAFATRLFGNDRWVASGFTVSPTGVTRSLTFRYTSDGILDTSFNTTGSFIRTNGTYDERMVSMYVGTLGKFAMFGYYSADGTANGNNFLSMRYTSNGRLDTQWNGNGATLTAVSSGDDRVLGAGHFLEGAIYVIGYTQGVNADFTIARYEGRGGLGYSGRLERSFGTAGSMTLSGVNGPSTGYYLDSNGRYLAFGFATSGADAAVINRYNRNGTLDTSWATTGSARPGTGGTRSCTASRYLLVRDDRYYLACRNGRIQRYTTNGVLDTSFNASGVSAALTTVGYGNAIMAFDSSGRIYYTNSRLSVPSLIVYRYTSNGLLDTSFRTTGISQLTVSMTSSFTYTPNFLAVNNSGKPAVGSLNYDSVQSNFSGALYRFETDGTLDTTFATIGYMNLGGMAASGGSYPTWISTDTSGEGYLYADFGLHDPYSGLVIGNYGYGVGRLTSNGSADTSFGNGGRFDHVIMTTPIAFISLLPLAKGGALGVFLMTTAPISGSAAHGVLRLRSDFSVDTGFNFNVLTWFSGSQLIYHNQRDVTVTPDGFISFTCVDGSCRYLQ